MTALAELLKSPHAGFEAEDDLEAVNEYCRKRGWSDGLPIVPPTQQRVERMLAYCGRAWDEPLAVTPAQARRTVAIMEAATRSIAESGARQEVDI